jgi:hypothetical protein
MPRKQQARQLQHDELDDLFFEGSLICF